MGEGVQPPKNPLKRRVPSAVNEARVKNAAAKVNQEARRRERVEDMKKQTRISKARRRMGK